MPNLLEVREIRTVGFVDKGANPESHVLLFKRAGPEDSGDGSIVGAGTPDPVRTGEVQVNDKQEGLWKRIESALKKVLSESEEEDGMKFDISSLPEAAQEAYTALATERDEAVTKAEEAEGQVSTLTEELTELKATPAKNEGEGEGEGAGEDGTPSEDVLKTADPAIREYIEKAEARITEANEKADEAIAKAKEERALREEETIRKRFEPGGDLADVPGSNEDKLTVLKSMAGTDAAEAIEAIFKATSAQLRESKLYDAFGKDGSALVGANPYEKLEHIAKKIQADSEEGISASKAMKLARERNPDLADEYAREMNS